MKTTTRLVLSFIILCLVAVAPTIQMVVPPPDGGYPGFNTAEGQKALFGLTTGTGNVAVGWGSLYSDAEGSLNTAIGTGALLLNTADQNTAIGAGALLFNDSGNNNTPNGAFALHLNTSGFQNTANGVNALFNNTTGNGNVADGYSALFHNTTGGINTAIGYQALFNNTEGNSNTATGVNVLFNNTTGDFNTASGDGALFYNTVGNGNTATGYTALNSNTEGGSNTATGNATLFSKTTGVFNTASGFGALYNNTTGFENTANGYDALFSNTTGSNNTGLGYRAGVNVLTANNVICIGASVEGDDVGNTTWIGNVYGVTTQNGTTAPVIVSADGQLGTVTSSERFKKDIATMNKASEVSHALKPVTFHYKTDTTGTPQFGLIAEEVAKVNPALVLPDKEGKPYTVRYEAVNAMLLNEFLKEHRRGEEQDCKIQEQETTIAELRSEVKNLAAMVNEQTLELQKVSAWIETSEAKPQFAQNQ